MWEPGGLPLGEVGANGLVHAHSRCLLLKGGNRLQAPLIAPLILVMSVPGFHIDQLDTEATLYIIIHVGGNIVVIFLSLL